MKYYVEYQAFGEIEGAIVVGADSEDAAEDQCWEHCLELLPGAEIGAIEVREARSGDASITGPMSLTQMAKRFGVYLACQTRISEDDARQIAAAFAMAVAGTEGPALRFIRDDVLAEYQRS